MNTSLLGMRVVLVVVVIAAALFSQEVKESPDTAAAGAIIVGPDSELAETLVERLVSPLRSTVRNQRRVDVLWTREVQEANRRADAARRALIGLGTAAFDVLIEHVDDQRPSILINGGATGAEPGLKWLTVGEVCRRAIEVQIDQFNPGKIVEKDYFWKLNSAEPSKAAWKKWWQDNQRKAVHELQKDALIWHLQQLLAEYQETSLDDRSELYELITRLKRLEDSDGPDATVTTPVDAGGERKEGARVER